MRHSGRTTTEHSVRELNRRGAQKAAEHWRDINSNRSFDTLHASEQAPRVKVLNANWVARPDRDDGRFGIMVVTEDDQQHTMAPSPASMTALIALTQADAVLVWDPADRTLIAANLVGRMPWTERD